MEMIGTVQVQWQFSQLGPSIGSHTMCVMICTSQLNWVWHRAYKVVGQTPILATILKFFTSDVYLLMVGA